MNPQNSSLMSVSEKNTTLPKTIPKNKLSPFISKWQNKKHIKKYFGRKKFYVENRPGRTAALHRSKYFLKFKHTNTRIYAATFKTLGDLIFFATDLLLKGEKQVLISSRVYYRSNTNLIPWKTAFAYCKQTEYSTDEVSLYQKYMSCLKSLQIKISQQKHLKKLAKVMPNLRLLESVTLEYATDGDWQYAIVIKNYTFFAWINKLPRLQSFNFDTSITILQKEAIQKDIQVLCLKSKIPIIHVTIHRRGNFSEKGIKSLECFLKGADCLCLEFSNQNFCCNEDFPKRSAKERQRLVSQSRRIVSFAESFWPQDSVNINLILSHCDSLKFLYMKMSTNPKFWFEEYPFKAHQSKWCQSLQNVVLDFGFLYINPVFRTEMPKDQGVKVYDVLLQEREESKLVSKPSKLYFISPILNLMRQLRENAVSLENLSLFLCVSNLDSKNYNLDKGIAGVFEIEKKRIIEEFLEEISLMNKLKKLDLCSRSNLCDFPLNKQIMSLKCLENLKLGFCKKKEATSREIENNWDQCLGNGISHIKELKIKTSTSLKIQPFGVHLVTASNNFQYLQVLEIIDQNKMLVTFDLLYGLLINVFKSRDLRRVVISTNVINGFYSKNSNILFPQEVSCYVQQIEKELFEKLEHKIKELRELKLEEIMVGKLTGFSADYILYHKKLGTSKRVFWAENEFLQELKSRRLSQAEYYSRILGLNSES